MCCAFLASGCGFCIGPSPNNKQRQASSSSAASSFSVRTHCISISLTLRSFPHPTTTTTGWEAGRAAWCSPRPRPRRRMAGKLSVSCRVACLTLCSIGGGPPFLPPLSATRPVIQRMVGRSGTKGWSRSCSSSSFFPPYPRRFTVSVTPGLVSSLQKGSSSGGVGQGPAGRPEVVTTKEEAEEVAAAYRKGLKDAESNLRHHLVTQKVRLPPSLPPSLPCATRIKYLILSLPPREEEMDQRPT